MERNDIDARRSESDGVQLESVGAAVPSVADLPKVLPPIPFDAHRLKHKVYQGIISQLRFDGFHAAAERLEHIWRTDGPIPPSNRLLELVRDSMQQQSDSLPARLALQEMNLDEKLKVVSSSVSPRFYECRGSIFHRHGARCGAISRNADLIASGSMDGQIKVYETEKLLAGDSAGENVDAGGVLNHKICTDHQDKITCMQFHPASDKAVLVSGSRDMTVRVFDMNKPTFRRQLLTINEHAPVRALCVHPYGNHLWVATKSPELRLYDLTTGERFLLNDRLDDHREPVSAISYAERDGSRFATCSNDGAVKIWDGRICRVVKNLPDAHKSFAVCSVQFSHNGRFLLSQGKDYVPRLWDLRMPARPVHFFTGIDQPPPPARHNPYHHPQQPKYPRTQSVFNYNEDFVLAQNLGTIVLCWNARTGKPEASIPMGNGAALKHIVHAHGNNCSVQPLFLASSLDGRARLWAARPH